jgi:hypothetical protein
MSVRLVLVYRDSVERSAPAQSVRPKDGIDKATGSLLKTLLAMALLLEIASVIHVQAWTRTDARSRFDWEGCFDVDSALLREIMSRSGNYADAEAQMQGASSTSRKYSQ